MRVSKGSQAVAADVNMTPLIDLCFTLLIFLLSCNEMSKVERLEEVVLPEADMANPDQGEDLDRLVVNLDVAGNAIIDATPMPLNSATFRNILREQALTKLEKGTGFSDRALVIRAHKDMEFRYVQQLILECQRLKLWKIKLQVVLPEAETRKSESG